MCAVGTVGCPGAHQSHTFGTTAAGLLELADWLRGQEVTALAVQSTGVFSLRAGTAI